MDTFQLEDAIRRDAVSSARFGGVKAADELPTCVDHSRKFFIVNTHNSYQTGEHWVAMYLDPVPEFFDSLALSPEYYKKSFQYFLVNHGPSYRHNVKRLQSSDSIVCGQYCLFYIYHRSRNISMKLMFDMFSEDLESNDRLVSEFCAKVYGV